MLAVAQPTKSTPWNIGTRKRNGKTGVGLMAGSVTASVPRRLGGLIAGQEAMSVSVEHHRHRLMGPYVEEFAWRTLENEKVIASM